MKLVALNGSICFKPACCQAMASDPATEAAKSFACAKRFLGANFPEVCARGSTNWINRWLAVAFQGKRCVIAPEGSEHQVCCACLGEPTRLYASYHPNDL